MATLPLRRLPSRYADRHARRPILPLEVRGIAPAAVSSTSRTVTPWRTAIAARREQLFASLVLPTALQAETVPVATAAGEVQAHDGATAARPRREKKRKQRIWDEEDE